MPHGTQNQQSAANRIRPADREEGTRWPNAAVVLAELAALEAEFKLLLEGPAHSAAR
jgi:hypothetical protein